MYTVCLHCFTYVDPFALILARSNQNKIENKIKTNKQTNKQNKTKTNATYLWWGSLAGCQTYGHREGHLAIYLLINQKYWCYAGLKIRVGREPIFKAILRGQRIGHPRPLHVILKNSKTRGLFLGHQGHW